MKVSLSTTWARRFHPEMILEEAELMVTAVSGSGEGSAQGGITCEGTWPIRGISERQRRGARVLTTEASTRGGVSVLITRLERLRARMSCSTASTTSPVLKVITRGRAPPADGSMNLRQTEILRHQMMGRH